MNGPFHVAQADTSGTGGGGDKQHPRIVKITKPYGDQSVVVSLSYDGSVKADLSAIASDKITLVHIGEKLIILFDNHSTVTLEPFFDSTGKPLQGISVEVAPGRDITSAEFAALFPVTDDQSVLPAAGEGSGSGAQASGANFTSVGVDPLALPNPLDLLPQEELSGFQINTLLATNNQGVGPTPGFSLSGEGVVEDETSGVQSAGGANDQPLDTLPTQFTGLGEAIGWAQSHGPIVGASTATFGTAKNGGTITYALTDSGGGAFNGADSGLKATVSGNEIFLYTEHGLVVGREGTGVVPNPNGNVVFALYLDGSLKLDVAQYEAISHPDTNNPNDSVNLGGLVHVTQTVTADTLVATETSPAISISFLDDGPTIEVTRSEGNREGEGEPQAPHLSLSLDESIGGDRSGNGDGAYDDVGSNKTPDPTGHNPIGEVKTWVGEGEGTGQLQSLFHVVKDPGADGEKSTVYAYTFNLQGAGGSQGGGGEGQGQQGVATTLQVTDATGHNYSDDTIYLFQISPTEIVGHVGNDPEGAIAIRITLTNPGSLSGAQLVVDQYMAIDHGKDGNNFDSVQFLKLLGEGEGEASPSLGITLTATITDNDGDQSSSSSTIVIADDHTSGQTSGIGFQDDGPAVSITPHQFAANNLFVDGFVENNNAWNTGSGINTSGTAGGWTISTSGTANDGSGAVQLERVGDGYQGMHSSTGGFMVDLDASPRDVALTQTIAGLTAGQHYTLTFEAGAPVPDSAHLQVLFGGVVIADIPGGAMQTYTVDLLAGSGDGHNVLEFRETGTADNQGTYLANVSIGGPVVVIDETPGVDVGSNDTTDAAIAALFVGHVANVGHDTDMASPQYATGSVAAVDVTADFGTDGPAGGTAATGTSFALSLATPGQNGLVDSGLATTDGREIYLFNENGIIVGRYDSPNDGNTNVNGNDPAAFAITIDPTTGIMSVAQYVSLHNPDTTNPNDPVTLKAGALSAVVTVTDGDGDHASASADISAEIRFDDDGPKVSVSVDQSFEVTIDETPGNQNDDVSGPLSVFALVAHPGNDPDEPGSVLAYARSDTSALDVHAVFGADGPKNGSVFQATSYTLSVVNGTDSGLATTEGRGIYLFNENGIIVGRYDSPNDGNTDVNGSDPAAFAIAIDPHTGVVSIVQYVSLKNPDTHNSDDQVTLNSKTISAIVTVTDGDGDHATASADISGQIHFQDDGPSIEGRAIAVTVDEDDIRTAYATGTSPNDGDHVDGSFTGSPSNNGPGPADVFGTLAGHVDFGADGPGSNAYSFTSNAATIVAGLGLTSHGHDLHYSVSGDTLTAFTTGSGGHTVFTLAVDHTTGAYTFSLYDALDHVSGHEQNTTLDAHPDITQIDFGKVLQATDGDGDSVTLSGQLVVTIRDDVPIAHDVSAPRILDDEAQSLFTPVNPGGTGDVSSNFNSASGDAGTLFAPGADGFKTITFADPAGIKAIYKLDGGLAGQETVHYTTKTHTEDSSIAVGHTVYTAIGDISTNIVFTLDVDSDGSYTLKVNEPLVHPTHSSTEENLTVKIGFTVTDGDGDPDTGSLTFKVNDDTPTVDVDRAHDRQGDVTLSTLTLDESIHQLPGDTNATSDNVSGVTGPSFLTAVTPDIANKAIGIVSTPTSGQGTTIEGLFDVHVSFGADGKQAPEVKAYTFTLTNDSGAAVSAGFAHGVETNLVATALAGTPLAGLSDGARTIYLFKEADGSIVGRVGDNPNGDIALHIVITDSGSGPKMSVEQYLPIEHGNHSSNDESAFLTFDDRDASLGITLTVTATDGDGDVASDSKTVKIADSRNSIVEIQDDGPTLSLSHIDGIANGLFFDGFTSNHDDWGAGSGVAIGHADGWTITASDVGGFGSTQLEKVGDGYRGAHSPTHSVMVDLEASPGNVEVSQTIHGLAEGATYNLTFEIGLGTPNGGDHADTAKVEVFWNGVSIGVFVPNTGTMQTIALPVTALNGDNQLAFKEIGYGGDNTGTYLANVKLSNIIIVDETAGKDADSSEVDAASVSALFTGVHVGHDPDMPTPQYAQGSGAIVAASVDYGSDGPAAAGGLSYAFDLGSNGSVDSGLQTTEGAQILLVKDSDGRVLGVYSNTGDVAFALHIDAATGQVTVAQYVSLRHGDITSNDEGVSLGANTLGVSVTATDGDGDSVTKSLDISGNIRFEDDGPVALGGTVEVGKVYEDGLTLANSDGHNIGNQENGHTDTSVTIHASDLAQLVAFGADGKGGFGFNPLAQGAILSSVTSDGFAIHYAISGDTLSGVTADGRTVFTLVHQAGGDYLFTLTGNIDHPANGDSGTLTLNLAPLFTATDGDGDSVVLNGGLNIKIENDVPVVTAQSNLIVNGSFEQGHDDLQPGQWSIYHTLSGTWTSADTDNGNVPFEVQVNNTNGSGPGGVSAEDGQALIELDSDLSSGNLPGDDHVNGTGHTNSTIQQVIAGTEAGQTYELTFWYAPRPSEGDADSGSMEVLWNGHVVKTIDSSGLTPGAWQQITVFVEGTGSGNTVGFHATGQENSLGALIDNVSLVTAVVVDEDGLSKAAGDAVTGNNDSQPGDIVVPNGDGDNNETTATGLLGIKWGADSADNGTDSSDSSAGAFGRLVQDHPDGVGDRSVTFTNTTIGITGGTLTSHGDAILLSLSGDGTVLIGTAQHGSDAPRTVFEVSLSDDGSGSFRFVLKDALDHAPGQNENNINLSFNYTATDSDGDSAPGAFSVVVNDDMPVAKNDTDTVTTGTQTLNFDDIPLADGQEKPLSAYGDATHGYGGFIITQGGAYNPPGSSGYPGYVPTSGSNLAFIGEKDGNSHDGYLGSPGDPITIEKANGEAFTPLSIKLSSGATEPATVTITAYDAGNIAIGSPLIVIIHTGAGDSTPNTVDLSAFGSVDHLTIQSSTGVYFGFDDFTYTDIHASTTGNVITGIGTTTDVAGADALGADGGHVTAISSGSTTVSAADANGNLTIHGTYGALIINADGTYTYTRDAGSAGGHSDVFTYTLTDGDGDTSQATLTIEIGDSTPKIGDIPAAGGDHAVVYEAGLPVHNGEPAGSDASKPVTTEGTIAFTSVDGVSTVSLGSHNLSNSSATPTVFTNASGTMSAYYDYNVTTGAGTIHYSYTLTDNTLVDPSTTSFAVVVTDADSETNATAANLVIDIIDDAPMARLDTDSFGTGAIGTSISGNVITGSGTNEGLNGTGHDVVGADGAHVSSVTSNNISGHSDSTGSDNFVVVGQFGTLMMHEDGSYDYVRTAGTAGTDVFTYTLTDGDGDPSQATLSIDMASSGVPTATSSSLTVDEDNLSTGNHDSQAGDIQSAPVADSVVQSGSLGSYGPDGPGTFSFSGMSGQDVKDGSFNVQHDGTQLKYYWDATSHTLYGTTDTTAPTHAAANAAFKLVVDESNGNYTFTLLENIDHPTLDGLAGDNQENNVNLALNYTVTDSTGDSAAGTVSVTINDDIPVANGISKETKEGSNPTTNLVLVIDTSGSMGDDPGVAGYATRLALAKAAAIDLINDANVNQIMVVRFSSSAGHNTDSNQHVWTDKTDAIDYINSLTANGDTNYQAALNEVTTNWGNGPTAADKTLVYFLSDGQPTTGGSPNESNWISFLNGHTTIADVYAVGIGSGLTGHEDSLESIAWTPGEAAITNTTAATDPNVLIVTDQSQLSATLMGTLGGLVTGNVLGSDSFGADGGHIQSIVIGGITHTSAEGTHVTVTTSIGGSLTFYFTDDGAHHAGDYAYSAPASVNADQTETFHYTLIDNDGDTAGADLQIVVHDIPNVPPHIALNETGASATVSDDFSSGGYSGGTGWGSGHNWVEEGDSSGSASSGHITANSDALTFSKSTGDGDAISRHVDLSGKSSATVSFDYTVTSHHSDDITVQAWNNTTNAWEDIGTIDGSSNTSNGHFSKALTTDQIGANSGIRLVAADNFGGNQSITIDNVAIDYTTVIASDNHTASFTEDAAAVAIAAASLIADSDDSQMSSAKIVLTNEHAGDYLAINGTQLHDGSTGNINGIGYTVSDTGSAITVNLTGNDSLGDYQTAINAITYGSNSQDPSEANRVVDVTVADAHGNVSNTAETTITVHAVNDAPTLTAASNNATFTEGSGVGVQGAAVSVFKNAAVDTVESGQTIKELDFTISGLKDGANETIKVDGSTISLVSNSFGTTATDGMTYLVTVSGGVATVTLKSAAGISEAAAQALVNGIQYQNTNVDDPTSGNRTFTLTSVQDSGGTDNGGHDTTSLSIKATVGVNPIDDPTLITNGLHVISNYGGDAFTIPDAAFLNYVTDPDGSLTITGASGSGLTASHSGSAITIDDSGPAGGSFTFTVSDGTPPSATSGAVTYQQDTGDLTINGTSGNDIVVGATAQHTTIGFNAGGYDVGDKVSLIVDGTTYSYTVTSGHTSAESVYDGLKAVVGNALSGDGVTWASDLDANHSVTLNGALGETFTVTSGITNAASKPWITSVDFNNSIDDFKNSSGNAEHISIAVNGVTYSEGYTSGSDDDGRFDNAAGHLVDTLNDVSGITASYNASKNTFTITTTFDPHTVTGSSTSNDTTGSVTAVQVGSLLTDQPAPTVSTLQDGATLNGNGGDDYLIGSNGNDILFGGAGHDLLLGGDGDDKLHGDDGANILSGGHGADTFFLATTATADTVLDYSFSEGDKIDLSALLDTNFGPASNPADFVKLTQQGTDVHVQVDTNGPTGGANFVDVAILSHYGTSGADIVNAVFAGQEHQLHVTT